MAKPAKSTAVETAKYIGGMARELRALAAKSDFGFLAYLLSMVEQEADLEGGDKPSRAGNRPADG